MIGALFIAYAIGFLIAFASNLGQPEQIGGRYYDDNHGTVTEFSRTRYLQENAMASRIFAGGVVWFSAVILLSLTADPAEGDRLEEQRLQQVAAAWREPPPGARLASSGRRLLQGEVRGEPNEVMDRLRQAAPLAFERDSTSRVTVRGTWMTSGGRWNRYGPRVWVIGRIAPTLRGSTSVVLEVGPAGSLIRRVRLLAGGLVLAVVVLIAVAVLVSGLALLGLVWVVALGINLVVFVTTGRRATQAALKRIALSLGLPAP